MENVQLSATLEGNVEIDLDLPLAGASLYNAFGAISGKPFARHIPTARIVPTGITAAMTIGFFGPADHGSCFGQ
jgi:hypothetical protein